MLEGNLRKASGAEPSACEWYNYTTITADTPQPESSPAPAPLAPTIHEAELESGPSVGVHRGALQRISARRNANARMAGREECRTACQNLPGVLARSSEAITAFRFILCVRELTCVRVKGRAPWYPLQMDCIARRHTHNAITPCPRAHGPVRSWTGISVIPPISYAKREQNLNFQGGGSQNSGHPRSFETRSIRCWRMRCKTSLPARDNALQLGDRQEIYYP